jgi:hypothetical protein
MQRARESTHPTAAHGTQMICVDFQTHTSKATAVDDLRRRSAAYGFSKQHIGPAMNQSVGLPGTLVMRHACNKKVVTSFDKFDTELGYGGVLVDALKKCEIRGTVPNRHSGSLSHS